MPGWKVLPIDVNINVCEIHYNRLKTLIRAMIGADQNKECGVNRCHEKALYYVAVRVQNGVWEDETKKEGL